MKELIELTYKCMIFNDNDDKKWTPVSKFEHECNAIMLNQEINEFVMKLSDYITNSLNEMNIKPNELKENMHNVIEHSFSKYFSENSTEEVLTKSIKLNNFSNILNKIKYNSIIEYNNKFLIIK